MSQCLSENAIYIAIYKHMGLHWLTQTRTSPNGRFLVGLWHSSPPGSSITYSAARREAGKRLLQVCVFVIEKGELQGWVINRTASTQPSPPRHPNKAGNLHSIAYLSGDRPAVNNYIRPSVVKRRVCRQWQEQWDNWGKRAIVGTLVCSSPPNINEDKWSFIQIALYRYSARV